MRNLADIDSYISNGMLRIIGRAQRPQEKAPGEQNAATSLPVSSPFLAMLEAIIV